MTITRKTRLLAKPLKHVVIERMTAMYEDAPGITSLMVAVTNPGGIDGYENNHGVERAKADLYVNGASKGQLDLIGSGDHVFASADPSARLGDTVKVVFHIDPTKTDFDQSDVAEERTVVPFS